MSLTKRIFIERDPAYEDIRRARAEEVWAEIDTFTHRIPVRRRNTWSRAPYWDPLWPHALSQAAKQLAIQSYNVNDSMRFNSAEDALTVKVLAEQLWQISVAQFKW